MGLLDRILNKENKGGAAGSVSADLFSDEFLARLESLALASRRTVAGVRRGERRSRKKGSGVEFADHRNYVSGDDIRFLDEANQRLLAPV